MWQEVFNAAASGGGNIKTETFLFDNTVDATTAKAFEFTYSGTALALGIVGEAYNTSGARASAFDTAAAWEKSVPVRSSVKYGAYYSVNTVPTTTATTAPTIYSWNGNTVTFKASNNANYARAKYTVTVISEE